MERTMKPIMAEMLVLLVLLVALAACVQVPAWPGSGTGPELALSFQPVQCVKPPWQIWEENSGRMYIRAPTEAEIITHYYAAIYNVTVRNVTMVESGGVACTACGVCPETYRFRLTVHDQEARLLFAEGWTRET